MGLKKSNYNSVVDIVLRPKQNTKLTYGHESSLKISMSLKTISKRKSIINFNFCLSDLRMVKIYNKLYDNI